MDENLYQFATEAEKKYLDALKKHGSERKAAKAIGRSRGSLTSAISTLKKRAAKRGYSPTHDMKNTTPDGYMVKGVSTLYDGEGNVKQQWVKTKLENEILLESLESYIDVLCSGVVKAKPTKKSESIKDSELMCGIFVGDGHIGMKAHGAETRNCNFDTSIASTALMNAIDDLVDRAPDAKTGMLVDVGDFMHSNTSHNTTFSGTPVDMDTRHHKTMRTAAEVMMYSIGRMLDKFDDVVVIVSRGNHNPDAAIAVQLILEFYYSNEPRVNVLPTEGFFHYLQWGKWLFGINHGDKVKPEKLVSVMARDMSKAWGETTHRMWAVGHFHHRQVLELDGCVVQKFGAITPPDGWHASMGFGSSRVMEMITFKKSGGRHSTYIHEIELPQKMVDLKL